MLRVFGVSVIPVFVVRLLISCPEEFCSFHLGVCEQSLCHGPVELFLLQQWGTEEKCGEGFLSLTVIMQLVFECSYHTNVDHLHFQSCVPGYFQYSIVVFHFTFFLMSALNQVALSVQLTPQQPARIFWRQTSVFGCEVMDNMENKQCYCDVIPMSCHVVNGFYQHVITNGR